MATTTESTRHVETMIAAISLCLGAALFLLGFPMSVIAWHWLSLTWAYCGVAVTFCASMYFATKGARSFGSAVLRGAAIAIVVSVASYMHYVAWLTDCFVGLSDISF